jgi:hypothetical protein
MKLLQFLLIAQLSVVQQIERLPSPAAAPQLGAKLLDESRSPASAAVEAWRGGSGPSRQKARAVLNEMDEATLHPLLTLAGKLPPDDQVWRMTMVVETLGDLRRDAAQMLDAQLDNKEPAPVTPPEVPHRVCDDAYLLMNQLAAANPESPEVLLHAREFLRLSNAARDAEIRRARQSAAWRSLRHR